MGSLGKIFGPLVLVLAIAAAVLSFLLFQQRMKFRERAAIMAEGLAGITAEVDADAQKGTAGKVTFTRAADGGKEGGTLGWEACKQLDFSTDNAFKGTVNEALALVREVRGQRQELREKVIDIANSLKCPASMLPKDEAMAALADYSTSLDGFARFAQNYAARFNSYASNLNEIARKVNGKQFSVNSADGALTEADKAAFDTLKKNIQNVIDSAKALAGMPELAKAKLTEFNAWTFKSNALSSADASKGAAQLKPAIDDFLKDLGTVNGELVKYTNLKASYAALEDKFNDLDARYAQLEKDAAEKDELIKRLQGLTFPGITYSAEESLASIEEVNPDVIGSVVSVDAEYKVVIVNLNQAQVVPGLRLAVCAGETYIGSLKVISANEHNTVAVLVNGDIARVAAGQSVVISADSLQGLAE